MSEVEARAGTGGRLVAGARAGVPAAPEAAVPAVGGGGGLARPPEPGRGPSLVDRLPPLAVRRSGRLRRIILFVVFFLVPAVVGCGYFGLVAADRYATEVRFAIKSSESRQSDILSALTGLPSAGGGGGLQEAYLVVAYLVSREAVEELEGKVDLRAIYTNPRGDWWQRLAADAPVDDLVDYWGSRLATAVDLQSNSVGFEVQAFTPEDARRIAEALLGMAERLVNDINTRAHQDAVRFAGEQLTRAEARLDASRQALREFRDWQANLDPTKTADTALATISGLTNAKLQLEQELAQRKRVLAANSPIIIDLTGRIAKIQEQIDQIRATITTQPQGADGKALSGQIGRYEQLQTEQEFARKLYETALASLEQARATANKQQLFIVPFVRPALAESPKYPNRPVAIIATLLGALAAWLTATLIALGIRDHVI